MDISSISASDFGLANVDAQNGYASIQNDINKTQSFQDALEQAAQKGDDTQLMSACKQFEAYFMNMMFQEMRKTTGRDDDSLIPTSQTEDYFQESLDEQYSQLATDSGGIGLAKFLYQQLSGQYQNAIPTVAASAETTNTNSGAVDDTVSNAAAADGSQTGNAGL